MTDSSQAERLIRRWLDPDGRRRRELVLEAIRCGENTIEIEPPGDGSWLQPVLTGLPLAEQVPGEVDLRGIDLSGVDLRAALWFSVRLDHARLDRALLDGANLQGLSLDRASLVGVQGRRAVFSMSRGAARFDRAMLDHARFAGARLGGSSFRGASLIGASFVHADLGDVDLADAQMHGVDLLNAVGLERALLPEPAAMMPRDMRPPLEIPIIWDRTDLPSMPYQVERDGEVWVVRLNPQEQSRRFCLTIDGKEACRFDDLPRRWTVRSRDGAFLGPGGLRPREVLVRWAMTGDPATPCAAVVHGRRWALRPCPGQFVALLVDKEEVERFTVKEIPAVWYFPWGKGPPPGPL